MKKIVNDEEAIKLIQFLYDGLPVNEQEWDDIEDLLEEYQTGISNTLRLSKELLPPEEALRLARENNKPILL